MSILECAAHPRHHHGGLLGVRQQETSGVLIVPMSGCRIEVHVPPDTEQSARDDRDPEHVLAHSERDQVTTERRH